MPDSSVRGTCTFQITVVNLNRDPLSNLRHYLCKHFHYIIHQKTKHKTSITHILYQAKYQN